MILSQIHETARYDNLAPALGRALAWLRAFDPSTFAKGTLDLGAGIIAKCEEPSLMAREHAALEAHRRYIDIHVPLKGTETIGWAPLEGLKYERQPYDPDRDIAFFGDGAHSLLHVKPGQCAIFFPEDAHAPCIGLGTHRKICIKIPI